MNDYNKLIYEENKELTVMKSNRLITGRNGNSLTNNKILTYAMAKAVINESGNPVVEFNLKEFEDYQGINRKTMIRAIKLMDETGINRSIMIPDEHGSGFTSFSIVDTFRYDGKGHVMIKFTQGFAEHIKLSANYTTNQIRTLFSFQSNNTYRIYELLSVKRYLFREKRCTHLTFDFDLYELKLQLGLINIPLEAIERLRRELKKQPTAKEIFCAYPGLEPYPKWTDFKRSVLDKAEKEMEEKVKNGDCDCFTFHYEKLSAGIGGKVMGVRFHMYQNQMAGDIPNEENKKENSKNISSNMDITTMLSVFNIMKEEKGLQLKDISALLSVSQNDVSKIEKAYQLAKQQPYIQNLIGWMIQCIKDEYTSIPSANGLNIKEIQYIENFVENRENKKSVNKEEHYITSNELVAQCKLLCNTGKVLEFISSVAREQPNIEKDDDYYQNIEFCFTNVISALLHRPLTNKTLILILTESNYNLQLLMKAILDFLDKPATKSESIEESLLCYIRKTIKNY